MVRSKFHNDQVSVLSRIECQYQNMVNICDLFNEHFTEKELQILSEVPYIEITKFINKMIEDPEDPDYYFDRDRQVGIKIRYEEKLKKERIVQQ